jgi:hypothetical protein
VYYAPALAPALDEGRAHHLLDTLIDETGDTPERADGVWCLVPKAPLPDGMDTEPATLVEHAAERLGGPAEQAPTTTGALPVLAQLRRALAAGGIDSIWLIAVQSLIDGDTIRALADDRPLKSQGSEGLVPSEAAVALRLTAGVATAGEPVIRGLASREAAGSAANRTSRHPLADSIRAACAEAGREVTPVADCFSDNSGDTDAQLEWWRTTQQLWPAELPEDQRRAVELGLMAKPPLASPAPRLIHPPGAIGHSSVAGALAQLALAHRHWDWQQRCAARDLAPPPGANLITEHPLAAHRHAAVLATN